MTAAEPRLAIDYVSPLPPVRSGISDYSVDLFPALSQVCDLRLVRLPDQEVDTSVREQWPVVEADRLGENGRLPLYHMGNNQHHLAIWDLAMAHPGVLVLHDLVLHHFLIERTVKHGALDDYTAALEDNHGWIGEQVGRPVRRAGAIGNAAQFELPAHRTLLLRQKGILTHSAYAARRLAEDMPELRVRHLNMGMPLPAAAQTSQGEDFKRRYGLPTDVPILGSFGFQTPIKRTEVVVRALAEPGLETVHLMVAGEVSPSLQLEETAHELGVLDRLHVLGFLPFEDFEAGIAAADLALNLRYPTAGETSASLLRILAVGRPVVVSDYAQSADLPDDVAIKAPLGDDEPQRLARRIAELLQDPDGLRKMGRLARAYVESRHRLDEAAEAMVQACGDWRDLEPPAVSSTRCERPSSFIWHDLKGEIEVEGLSSSWRPGERRELAVRLKNRSAAVWLAGERGDGGVALQIRWVAETTETPTASSKSTPWIGLPIDLPPGHEHTFKVRLRRPLGSQVRLDIIPHTLGAHSFQSLGGPTWSRNV